MKRIAVLVLVLVVGFGGYVAASHISGGAFFAFGIPVGGERGWLRRTSLHFLEDIQFKDFVRGASYHSPEKRASVDIPFLLQRLFMVKPEQLDLMDYEVVLAEVDSTGNRARVKTRMKAKLLVNGTIQERELMLYYERENARAPWFMKLEDSLRDLDKDPTKKG